MRTRLSPASRRVSIPVLIIVFQCRYGYTGVGNVSPTDGTARALALLSPSSTRGDGRGGTATIRCSSAAHRAPAVCVGDSNLAQNSLTPNLLNLTQTPTIVTSKMPAWSPDGRGISPSCPTDMMPRGRAPSMR